VPVAETYQYYHFAYIAKDPKTPRTQNVTSFFVGLPAFYRQASMVVFHKPDVFLYILGSCLLLTWFIALSVSFYKFEFPIDFSAHPNI
jgi:hypothetical protein